MEIINDLNWKSILNFREFFLVDESFFPYRSHDINILEHRRRLRSRSPCRHVNHNFQTKYAAALVFELLCHHQISVRVECNNIEREAVMDKLWITAHIIFVGGSFVVFTSSWILFRKVAPKWPPYRDRLRIWFTDAFSETSRPLTMTWAIISSEKLPRTPEVA